MAVSDYITAEELRAYMRDTTSLDASMIADAITAASREIDSICHRYFFQLSETAYFRPTSLWTLDLEDKDIATSTGLTVATSTANDGTYATTWTVDTDFILESTNTSSDGITSWPWTGLRACGTKFFPPTIAPFWRPTVKITGTFGWPAVPVPVKQATKIAAAELYKLAEAAFGVAGFGSYGAVRIKDNPVIDRLLTPYKKWPDGGAFG